MMIRIFNNQAFDPRRIEQFRIGGDERDSRQTDTSGLPSGKASLFRKAPLILTAAMPPI